MASKYGFLLLVVATSIFAVAAANKNLSSNWNHTATATGFWGYKPNNNMTQSSNTFVVGGSENWRFGFNYTDWAIKNAPFFLNDTLVFKYDPPNDTTFPHSVYLLPDFWSFQNCDLRRGKKIGDVNDGGGAGLEVVLKRWQPYYFVCGQRDGFHCKVGLMKFAVWPLIRSFSYHH